ncbi:helix-turn-helix transcriptional regulator [Bradyrhizobium sp. 138]|nr:helix-turn-helix transcriptional regulator [Bradyrhizobium sp. 138]
MASFTIDPLAFLSTNGRGSGLCNGAGHVSRPVASIRPILIEPSLNLIERAHGERSIGPLQPLEEAAVVSTAASESRKSAASARYVPSGKCQQMASKQLFHSLFMMDISVIVKRLMDFSVFAPSRLMMDKSFMSEIAKRIQERLDLLGKSASAASLEAGLGRSALQDILTGKSQNPRLDTLRKLTEPLECSLSYLTGDPPGRLAEAPAIEWGEQLNEGEDVHRVEVVGIAQLGTIRGTDYDYSKYNPVIFTERDPRFKAADLLGFLINDTTLEHIHVQPNDVLLAVPPAALKSLRTGAIVVVERHLPHAFDSEDHVGIETTAREVQFVGNELHLTVGEKGASSKPIIISEKQQDRFLAGNLLDRPMVRLVGIAVKLTRELPA